MATRVSARAIAIARALGAASDFVSGETLARAAGVSRVAVRKHVQRMVEAGAVVEAKAGAGYRVLTPPERPDGASLAYFRGRAGGDGSDRVRPCSGAEHVEAAVRSPGPRLGWHVEYLPEVTSTNDVAMAAARAGAPEGLVVTADVQTRGRGRRGRAWESPAGGLYLSVLLRPQVAVSELTKVGLMGALAVVRALDGLGVAGSAIKWPNDVVVGGRKLAGVLTEASLDAEGVGWVVLGLGANITGVPVAVGQAATSVEALLRDGTAQPRRFPPPGRGVQRPRAAYAASVGRAQLAAAILRELSSLAEVMYAGEGASIIGAVAERCETLRRRVAVTDISGATTEGTAIGLAQDGALRLATDRGEITLVSGDVVESASR